ALFAEPTSEARESAKGIELIGLHSLQRFPQILPFTDLLHQLWLSSRAFGVTLHHGTCVSHGQFDPFRGLSSFTRRLRE
ncbi:MAG TPA: hypothetical protein VEK84_15640, partial [Terriglobales bacterium]|nr:hypothetical protein [Terriglobales bacterium]